MSRLPSSAAGRKAVPLARGLLDYFPDALCEVAALSAIANEQHNPGEPMHWAKEKSTDEADALLRHLIDRGVRDADGLRHSAKVAWRALALLQREIDAEVPESAIDQESGREYHEQGRPPLHGPSTPGHPDYLGDPCGRPEDCEAYRVDAGGGFRPGIVVGSRTGGAERLDEVRGRR